MVGIGTASVNNQSNLRSGIQNLALQTLRTPPNLLIKVNY